MRFPICVPYYRAVNLDHLRKIDSANGQIVTRPASDPRNMSHKNKMARMRDAMIDFFVEEDVTTGNTRVYNMLTTLAKSDPKAVIPIINKLVPSLFETQENRPQGHAPIILNIGTPPPQEPKQPEVIEADYIADVVPKIPMQNSHPVGEQEQNELELDSDIPDAPITEFLKES